MLPNFPFRDLSQYVEKLKELNLAKDVTEEVDWNLEAAALTVMACKVEAAPPVFRKVKDYPPGFALGGEIFTGTFRHPWRNLAVALGLDPKCSYADFLGEVGKGLMSPIKPMMVAGGLCKEEMHFGAEADLLEFPWPYVHDGDGGRYGTISNLIQKDPESEWVNWGNYRFMISTRHKIAPLLHPGTQAGMMYFMKYESRGQNMPACYAVGGNPCNFMMSGTPLPAGWSEVDFAGGMSREPIILTKSETTDLPVPADSEIIMEGEIRAYERIDEGPHAEYIGFVQPRRHPAPCFRVHAITHRKNPILPFVVEGIRGVCNVSTSMCSTVSSGPLAALYQLMNKWPVTMSTISAFGQWSIVIVSTGVPYPGYVHDLANDIFSHGLAGYFDHMWFVDADVNVNDIEAVLEEIATKAHPVNDVHITWTDAPRTFINVYQTPEERKSHLGAKVYIDATTKKWNESGQGPRRYNTASLYSKNILDWVKANGGSFGLS